MASSSDCSGQQSFSHNPCCFYSPGRSCTLISLLLLLRLALICVDNTLFISHIEAHFYLQLPCFDNRAWTFMQIQSQAGSLMSTLWIIIIIFFKGSCTLSCGGGIFSTHAWRLLSVEAVCQMDVVTDTWELVFFVLFFCFFLFLLLGSWSGFAGWMDVALNRCQPCCYNSCYNRD